MKFRTMDIEDYEKVYDLWIHTVGMGLNTTDDSREGIAKYLLRNPDTCFVAEDNGEIVGVIMSGHDGRRGFIHHTTVKEEYRGQGIGKKLVDSALVALEAEGIHKVALVAFEKNISGNIFWEKIGFSVREDLIYRNKSIHELKRIDII
ncbi:MAG: GNAT family N-acetyltransferase [Lachnospiraceae bacterium]|nr:GNAT family N-acetyltransferase [Lachnospiraceae bacterium]